MTTSIFTQKDYNSRNGFATSIFGPAIWFNLHLISFNYPVNPTSADKTHYKNWFLSHQYTLPCIYCRNSFKKNLIKARFNDKVFNNRETFSRFVYILHNIVNEMLGKNVNITYEEVRDKFENFRSRCSEQERANVLKEKEKKVKEKKCESLLYGIKSKSVIKIIPSSAKTSGLIIDPKCKTKKSKKKLKK